MVRRLWYSGGAAARQFDNALSQAQTKMTSPTQKIVVLSGAGISAASGIATFRDSGGLWENHRIEDVATPEGWQRNPELVLKFYNERRAKAAAAIPNPAHLAIAKLQERFDVVVVTQNVDDLHERAGSKQVLHLHGELNKARSSVDSEAVIEIGARPIELGETCVRGSQLRPHIVWFGEQPLLLPEACRHIRAAGRMIVVGTSLSVYPAAGLIEYARPAAEKIYIDVQPREISYGFRTLVGPAEVVLPELAEKWLAES